MGVCSSVVEGASGKKALSWHCPALKAAAGSAVEDVILGTSTSELVVYAQTAACTDGSMHRRLGMLPSVPGGEEAG